MWMLKAVAIQTDLSTGVMNPVLTIHDGKRVLEIPITVDIYSAITGQGVDSFSGKMVSEPMAPYGMQNQESENVIHGSEQVPDIAEDVLGELEPPSI